MLQYNDQTLKRLKEEIFEYRDAFLGGTDIYAPLSELFDLKKKDDKFANQTWNVFLLTDGCVSD